MAAFRFLDLHPELRNRVYELYYEDNTPLALIELKNISTTAHPAYDLTRVSHQLRSESLGYYKDACNTFWHHHSFKWHAPDGIPPAIKHFTFRKHLATLPRLQLMNACLGRCIVAKWDFIKGIEGEMKCPVHGGTVQHSTQACVLSLLTWFVGQQHAWEEEVARSAAA